MIQIDREQCTKCLRCFEVCPDYVFAVETSTQHKQVDVRYPLQCCTCGHCVAICPSGAINHPGLSKDQIEKVDNPDISPNSLCDLMKSRRSTRQYQQKPVLQETIDQLLDVAIHAGTGGNTQIEGFIIIQNQDLIQKLELCVIDILWKGGMRFLNRKGMIAKIAGRKYGPKLSAQYQSYHDIIKHRRQNGDIKGMIFRNAPVLIIVHSHKNNNLGPTNAALALRNIELFGATLGIASCWTGFLIAAARMNRKKINQTIDLDKKRLVVGGLMLGYPKFEYRYQLPRKNRDVLFL